jgi:hypothetical protein
MATRLVGALAAFEPGKMQWSSYAERMEEYLLANGIINARKKVAILLSTVGESTYELLCDLFAPKKPNTKTFEELVARLTEHLQPKPTVISERYRFHQRSQKTGESVTEFMAALRRLAKDCAFGAFLQEALRDRFVCGLASEAIRKELLKDKNLTLETACDTATAMAAAATDSSLMANDKIQDSLMPVNRLQEECQIEDNKNRKESAVFVVPNWVTQQKNASSEMHSAITVAKRGT